MKNKEDININMRSWVVMPTIARNFSYFQESVQSILDQSHVPDKISIIFDIKGIEKRNNNSQALKFQDWIWSLQQQHLFEILENKRKQWPWATRNMWIDSLTSKNIPLIFFLDDDDIWYKDKCRQQLLSVIWVSLEKFWAIWCNTSTIDENSNIFAHRNYPLTKNELVDTLWLLFRMSSLLVSSEALLHIGWFNENLETAEDMDLFFRLIEQNKDLMFSNLSEELVWYRFYNGNISHEQWFQQRLNGFSIFLKRYSSSQKKLSPEYMWLLFQRCLSLFVTPNIMKKYNEYLSKYK